MRIDLTNSWVIGQPLSDGEGGFGRVYEATDDAGQVAVAKFVPKEVGADRELLFGDSIAASKYRNVMPVIDSGEHGTDLILIMPRADRSLRSFLADSGGRLAVEEAIKILSDIATALVDLDGQIVHRDLKPDNILLLDGAWHLSDFGISRYAAAATGADTRKFNLTEPYAAPEQWRMEHATGAVDVYALWVVAHEILAGKRPFAGPDYRSQHLQEVAPPVSTGTPRLRVLIEECMHKPPNLRPTPRDLLDKLSIAGFSPASPGIISLAEVNRLEVERISSSEAEDARVADEAAEQAAQVEVAERTFESFVQPFLNSIRNDAPIANVDENAGHGTMHFVATLSSGKLGLSKVKAVEPWVGTFTVIAEAMIVVSSDRDGYGYEGRSHSLWYCDALDEGKFEWFETAFMSSPFTNGSPRLEPYSLEPSRASVAFGRVTGSEQVAWPPTAIDRADPSEFVDRWIGWFAEAASRTLTRPSPMPEKVIDGTWRT